MKVNIGNDLYLKGRIGWKGLSKDEYLDASNYRIINGYSLEDGYIDWEIAGYISEERYEESPEIKLEIGDILISKDGTLGKVGIVRELVKPTTVASGIFVLRNIICNQLDTEYLFQYLKSSNFKAFINNVKASGSTILHLYQRDLQNLEIEVPTVVIQQRISKILFNLDAKIELNNKINAELEAIAKLIYDYWFVQFDFPDENGEPYKSSGGKMVWNTELKREIPEGWDSAHLEEIANIIMGQSPPGESYNEEGIGTVFYQGCTDFGTRFPSNRKFTTQPSRHAKKGDILLSVRAPVGTMNIANEDCCIGRGLAALNSKDNCISYLDGVLQYMKQIFDRRNSDGTTFGSITKGDLFSLPVIKPNGEILKKFDSLAKPMFEKQNIIGLENQKLAELRDWLLPMLMNGQVRVAENEVKLRMVAEPKVSYDNTINDKRIAIAACIILNSEFEEGFGMVKFEKLLHLSEYHVVKNDYQQSYSKHAAGPLDSKFTYSFIKEAKSKQLISIEQMGKLQRIKVSDKKKLNSIIETQLEFEERTKIKNLIRLFLGSNYEKPEIVSTLYAVWNNRMIKNELINDELIKKDFLNWSKEKLKYKDKLDRELNWMRTNGIVPDGWGEVI